MIATSHFVIFCSRNLNFYFGNPGMRKAVMLGLAGRKIFEWHIYRLGRGKLMELLPQLQPCTFQCVGIVRPVAPASGDRLDD